MKRELKQLVGLDAQVTTTTEWDWRPAQCKTVRDLTDKEYKRVLHVTSSGLLITRGTTCVGIPMKELMKLVVEKCPEFASNGQPLAQPA